MTRRRLAGVRTPEPLRWRFRSTALSTPWEHEVQRSRAQRSTRWQRYPRRKGLRNMPLAQLFEKKSFLMAGYFFEIFADLLINNYLWSLVLWITWYILLESHGWRYFVLVVLKPKLTKSCGEKQAWIVWKKFWIVEWWKYIQKERYLNHFLSYLRSDYIFEFRLKIGFF